MDGSVWHLYILRCCHGELYTGIAVDVQKRFEAHCSGKGAKFTRGRGPLKIVYQEVCGTRSDALKRELHIKALPKEKKEALIADWKE